MHILGIEPESTNRILDIPDKMNYYDLIKISLNTNIAHINNTTRSSLEKSKLHFSILCGANTINGYGIPYNQSMMILGKIAIKETFGNNLSGFDNNEINIFVFELGTSSEEMTKYFIEKMDKTKRNSNYPINIIIGIYPVQYINNITKLPNNDYYFHNFSNADQIIILRPNKNNMKLNKSKYNIIKMSYKNEILNILTKLTSTKPELLLEYLKNNCNIEFFLNFSKI